MRTGTPPRTPAARPPRPSACLHRGARARPPSTAPKIDFVIRTSSAASGSSAPCRWITTCPIRFDLSPSGPTNAAHRPVMIHRAPFGSMERFCGVLIEHFAGDFPARGSRPSRCARAHQREDPRPRPRFACARLRRGGFRATIDEHSDKLGAKIRRAEIDRCPYAPRHRPEGSRGQQRLSAAAPRRRGRDDGRRLPREASSTRSRRARCRRRRRLRRQRSGAAQRRAPCPPRFGRAGLRPLWFEHLARRAGHSPARLTTPAARSRGPARRPPPARPCGRARPSARRARRALSACGSTHCAGITWQPSVRSWRASVIDRMPPNAPGDAETTAPTLPRIDHSSTRVHQSMAFFSSGVICELYSARQ